MLVTPRRLTLGGIGLVAALVAALAAQPAMAAPSSTYPKGIDVSEWQSSHQGNPDVDWAAQAAAGVTFAYIKASGGYKVTNEAFTDQWTGSAAAGILHGAYHLAAPNLPTSDYTQNAITQADYFASKAAETNDGHLWETGGMTLPPALDMENLAGSPDCFDMKPSQLRSWISTFVKEATAKIGRTPVVYSNSDFFSRCIGSTGTAYAASPLWKASYGSAVGTIPSSWSTWTFWQWHEGDNAAGSGGTDYDRDVFNGSMTSLRLLADPTYGFSNSASTRDHDYNGDGKTDVLAITSGGALYDYRGAGSFTGSGSGFLSPSNVEIATGMTSYNAFAAVGKATSSGNPGLYARGKSGTLYFFPVSPKGYLGARVTVASGWSTMSRITSAGDFTGDGYADLIATDSVGVLWLYVGDKAGKFSGRVQLATGWNSKNLIAGGSDFTGDGYADLLARDSAGGLALYSHVPKTAGLTKRTLAGTSWNDYTKLFTPGDFTGDGKADLMGIGKSGQMYVFPGTGDAASPFGSRLKVGTTTSWGSRLFLG